LHGLYGFGKAHPNLNKAPISFFKMKLNIKKTNYHQKIGRCLKFSTIIAQNFFPDMIAYNESSDLFGGENSPFCC